MSARQCTECKISPVRGKVTHLYTCKSGQTIVPITEVFDEFEIATSFVREGEPIDAPDEETVFLNSIYQVNRRYLDDSQSAIHLSIKRRDKAPCKDWRHFQWIKNDLVGSEWIGMEVYPPEKYLVDTANQYHIWCFPDPDCLPFIWKARYVSDISSGGAVQRPWPEYRKPDDLLTLDQLNEFMAQLDDE